MVAEIAGMRLKVECKRRAKGFRESYGWLETADVLVKRADRRGALIEMPLDLFLRLIKP